MAFEDLLKDSSYPLDNKNYFNLVITDLNISTAYPLQFRWKYEDGSFGPWSVAKTYSTAAESFPNIPSTLTVAADTAGYLEITWNGNSSTGAALTNFDRVDIYINGAPFDGAKAALSFFSAGTKTIVAPAGTYIVSAFAVSKIGTLSSMNTAVTRTITSSVPAAAASATPSTPTVSSVLGAIQVSWDGKQSGGSPQPYGFNAAKVYIGTSAGFTPSASNQVDVLNFANGQNTLNIGVGTIVNSVALTYGVDYYVKIATTNGTDTSTAVSATGNPVRIGQVTSGDIVTINADKIATGTLAAGSTITVGSTAGKHVVIAGTGDPLAIYGSGGLAGGPILSFNGTKLSIVGDGTFSGNLAIGSTSTASVFKAEPATGIWLGDQSFASAPFSVAVNGVIKANSGYIGGWLLAATTLTATNFEINSSTSTISVGPLGGSHLKIIGTSGIASYTGGTANNVLNITTAGQITATNVNLTGAITANSGSVGTWSINAVTGVLSSGTTSLYGGVDSTAIAGADFCIFDNSKRAKFFGLLAGSDGVQSSGDILTTGSADISLIGTGDIYLNTKTAIYGNGTIFANTLGTGSGLAIHQVQTGGNAGYLKVNTSTVRHKENIVPIDKTNYINIIDLLNPVTFNYKEDIDPDKLINVGLVAEDLEQIPGLEKLVVYGQDGLPIGISYDKLPVFLILALKEIKDRLDALEG